jgi:hypothetical protein
MAAKPKLTTEEWNHAREVWEADPRKGFPWLIDKLDLPVSSEALRLRSKQEGWVKSGADKKPSLETKTKLGGDKKNKLGNKDAKPKQKTLPTTKTTATEHTEHTERGRPTLYKPEYTELAYNYCLLGATDEKLANFFNVDVRTIDNWKLSHDDFFQALKQGKEIANMEIAKALFHRAKGYVCKETKAALHEGQFVTLDLEKHYPPDTGAIKVWLYNRDPENWKDKIEVNSSVKLDKELLDMIENQFLVKMQEAHARQRAVLLERGITIDQE